MRLLQRGALPLLFIILFSCMASAQISKFYIRADSTYILKVGGNNELILENGTRSVNGLLTNVGNGRTQFIGSRRVGDTLFIGKDTLLGGFAAARFGVSGEDARATAARAFSGGGNGFSIDSTQSMLLRSRGGSMGTRTHLIQSSGTGAAQTRLRAQSSAYSVAFSQIAVINTNEARPEILMTVVDTSINGTSLHLKGDTLLMSVDGSGPGAAVRYIMENMPVASSGDTTTFKLVVMDGDNLYKMDGWPSTGGGSSYTFTDGLTETTGTVRNNLITGVAGGQTIKGGTATTDDLILQSTTGVGATGALIQFKVGNNGATTAMTILNNGNVGIGNVNPAKIFHAAGPSSIGTTEVNNYTFDIFGSANAYLGLYSSSSGIGPTDGFQFGHETTGNYFLGRENVPSIFYTNNTEKFRIEAGGNVGIGDASPASLLTVGASDAFQVNSSGKIARYGASAITDGQVLIGNTAGTFEKASITSTGGSIVLTAGAGTLNIETAVATAGGTSTPTGTVGTNVDAVTPYDLHYTRGATSVTFAGAVDIDATVGSGSAIIELSLPIASNFSSVLDAAGTVTEGAAPGGTTGWIVASVANDRLVFTVTATTTGARTYFFSGSYRIR